MVNSIAIKNYICKRFLTLKDVFDREPSKIKLDCVFCGNENCGRDVAYENCPFQCIQNADDLFSSLMSYTHYYLHVGDGSEKEEAKHVIDNMISYYFRTVDEGIFSMNTLVSFCLYVDTHDICDECNGTGFIVDWDNVKQCEWCQKGMQEIIPYERRSVPIYGIQKYLVRSNLCINGEFKEQSPFVVSEKKTNELIIAGDDKFIQDYLNLPIFIDIEDYLPKYQVYLLNDFNEKFEIVEKEN